MRVSKYILCMLALLASTSMWGQYNPTNPAEPGAPVTQYTLTLQADPSGGGSFNLNAETTHGAGETFWVQAYNASNFTFVEWRENGEVISTNARFQYTMPARQAKLTAHYSYTPSSPTEPAEPNIPAKPVYSNLWLTAQPKDGGSFNISTGTSYEVGTSIRVQANNASNFTFVNWTQDGEVVSTSRTFNYVMLEGTDANRLVAHFNYTPGSPGDPAEPEAKKIYHRVYLMASPSGAGYFNTESGNQYEEGTQHTFRAYNNSNYTFRNWTKDGVVVSTNSSYAMTIPTEDVTLTANYTYNPGNPGEPSPSTTRHICMYGMTANGFRSQSVVYPIFLENTEDVYGMTVVVHFPEGFTVNTANAVQAERAAGHTLNVVHLEGNAYRFDLTGTTPITGQNGKVFDVPVTISADCLPNQSYQVILSNAARINLDQSKDVVNTRNGYIFVEDVKEDGLYAQFSYEKLHGRVQFNNLSADKATSYTWDFGDGTTSTEQSPLHTYSASGYYDVKLTVLGQSGYDMAEMTVLINDESTWVVDGTFFLDSEGKGVRYFATAQDLFTFMASKPITGNLKVIVKEGETFNLPLTSDNIASLNTIQTTLTSKGYSLTIASSAVEGTTPVLGFGAAGETIDANIVSQFIALGKQMVCNDVQLKLWDIGFNPSKIPAIEEGQTVLSGTPTAEVDFAPISSDLTFSWTASSDDDNADGYQATGSGNIPAMTAASGSATDVHLIYNIVASYGGNTFFTTAHTITLKPALEGTFTEMKPADGAQLETTTVTLTWNSITNAVYDVYLWNAANQRPTVPVAEGITDLSYTSRNFCQNLKTYKWQVVARNASQQIASDTLRFSIKMLPNLHLYSVQPVGEMEAGRTTTIQWTVRNDGEGTTSTENWKDRVWLIPDVYGGTNQTGCKLLATVANAKALAPGQEYTNSIEVKIDEQNYGSYYLLVAADMSSVTNIEWSSIGGSIVNPYNPVIGGNAESGTYAHVFATTTADGNQIEELGETKTHSDNFFYQKVEIAMPTMDEEDWNILKQAYQQMGSGEGWTRIWNFDVEKRTVQTLPGVSILGGHVTSIDLSANKLQGAFPTTLLTLPQIRSINLSNNLLEGDLGKLDLSDTESTIKALNISGNQFSGNIGAFAAKLPTLETLYADKNRFDDVNPMIAPTVTSLKIDNQTISKVLPVDLSDIDATKLIAQIPTILLYSHAQQSYGNTLSLTASADNQWEATVSISSTGVTFAKKGDQNTYRGQSGDDITIATDSGDGKGSTWKMKLSFAQGDANFSGHSDVVDLQAMINFAFEDYKDRPFNFTAANLWTDEIINVQDVVKMTDLLLTVEVPTSHVSSNQRAKDSDLNNAYTTANLYVEGKQLWLNATTPVAALEMTLRAKSPDIDVQNLKNMGFTCSMNSANGITRIVAYSMSGAIVPAGLTSICELNSEQVEIVSAVLSDANAEEIPVSLTKENTTSIWNLHIDNTMSDSPVYDLNGRQVDKSRLLNGSTRKGIYIQNGRKIVK